ncbi:MAG: SDR family NAD(P)-dependent oxidoreductase [Actinomycetes bacterium]
MSQTTEHTGRLAGKVAIVTGAARGIGRAAAVAMAREGASIAGLDIAGPVSDILEVVPSTADDLAETGRLVEATGQRWEAQVVDQRDIAALRTSVDRAVERLGQVDILFANAGVQAFKAIAEMDDRDWSDQIENNLTGTANVLRVVVPHMIERGSGRVIITSSTQGRHGTKYGSSYSASKWGLIGLAKSAALELAEHGITVNTVVPGLIDTPLTRHEERYAQALASSGEQPTGDPEQDEPAAARVKKTSTPLDVPWLQPEDVAPVVVFLASDDARMVTGATYDVTGGDSANNLA